MFKIGDTVYFHSLITVISGTVIGYVQHTVEKIDAEFWEDYDFALLFPNSGTKYVEDYNDYLVYYIQDALNYIYEVEAKNVFPTEKELLAYYES